MTAYILKVICCSGILLFAYRLFLEKENMHQFKRFYLLGAVALSLTIPLITIQQTVANTTIEQIFVATSTSNPIEIKSAPAPAHFEWSTVGLLLYAIGCVLMLTRFLWNITILVKSIRQNEKIKLGKTTLVLTNHSCSPYSFFNYIFLNRDQFQQNEIEREILNHELAHVKHWHSLDILLTELVLVFGWTNPVFFLYRRAIELNHEFIADQLVVNSFDIRGYQILLLSKSHSEHKLSLSSAFNYSFTKKRFLMMTKKTSIQIAALKSTIAFTFFVGASLLFSERSVAQQPKVDKKATPVNGAQQTKVDKKTTSGSIWISRKPFKATPNSSQWTFKDSKGDTLYVKSPRPLTDEEKAKFESDFLKLSSTPHPKYVPTKQDLDSWLDSKKYGVWIGDKQVDNYELKKYSPADFEDASVSALTKTAKNYGKHFYQVNLTKVNN